MNDKENRIAAFIASLPITPNADGTQSVIIPSGAGVIGEGSNGGNCINADRQQCTKSTNGGDCINHVSLSTSLSFYTFAPSASEPTLCLYRVRNCYG